MNKTNGNSYPVNWKYSMVTRLFLLISLLIAFETVLYVFLNSTFLEKYYMAQKRDVLIKAYNAIDEIYRDSGNSAEERSIKLEKISNDYSLQMMIFSGDDELLYTTLPTDAARFRNRTQGKAAQNGENGENSDGADLERHERPEPGPAEKSILTETDSFVIASTYIQAIDARNIELRGRMQDGNRVMLQVSVASIRESVKIANKFFIWVGILTGLCAIFIGVLISRRAARNIKVLSEAANRMAELDFSVRYDGCGKDEISVLGGSLNTLSGKLERAITELKKANIELMRDNDRKEQVDKKRREFLSNVSHELKTPISIIEAYAEGLNEMELDEESRRYYCDVILDESKKMGMMIRKLMSLMRIETGAEALDIERYDIAEQIDRILSQKRILIEQKGAFVEFKSNHPVFVWADEFLIEEAFVNFLINAVKYCGNEKKIKIFLESMHGRVRVSVFNSGNGISEEEKNDIWKSFYMADKARTRENGSCGLGLSIVAAIIEAHGQDYGVYNTEGGVVFWFDVDGEKDIEK